MARIGKQESLLRDRLDRFRDVGKYDCLVGFSGGKDSSYVIYRLRSHYNARVLAFTWDNGFLTDYARDNINRLVKEFDLELVPDYIARHDRAEISTRVGQTPEPQPSRRVKAQYV